VFGGHRETAPPSATTSSKTSRRNRVVDCARSGTWRWHPARLPTSATAAP